MKLGNLNGVEAWRVDDRVPPGSYIVRIKTAEDGTSSGGHPQVALELQIAAGDFAGAELRDWLTVTESSLGRVVQFLQAFRYPVPEGEFDLKVKELVGRTAEAVVRDKPSRKDPDKTFPEIVGYRLLSGDDFNDTRDFERGNGQTKNDAPLPF